MINWKSYLCSCDCDKTNDYNQKYLRHIVLRPPIEIQYNTNEDKIKSVIAIDVCLRNEIETLWNCGIRTTGCCCGHGISEPYILIHHDDISKTKEWWVNAGRDDAIYPRGFKSDGKLINIFKNGDK